MCGCGEGGEDWESRESEGVCECVCVCVRASARVRVGACARARARVCVNKKFCIPPPGRSIMQRFLTSTCHKSASLDRCMSATTFTKSSVMT